MCIDCVVLCIDYVVCIDCVVLLLIALFYHQFCCSMY